VFKLDQATYVKEGIEWTMIDFYDNQPCIDLIESKLGILDLLDEECRMPNGSDNSWLLKLHGKCTDYKHYMKPKIGQDTAFAVRHFADTVIYTANGFIEKNRDSFSLQLVHAIKNSKASN
jgi:myosin-5